MHRNDWQRGHGRDEQCREHRDSRAYGVYGDRLMRQYGESIPIDQRVISHARAPPIRGVASHHPTHILTPGLEFSVASVRDIAISLPMGDTYVLCRLGVLP